MIWPFVLCARLVVFPESDNGLLGRKLHLKVNREKSHVAPADEGRVAFRGKRPELSRLRRERDNESTFAAMKPLVQPETLRWC